MVLEHNPQLTEDIKDRKYRDFKVSDTMREINGGRFLNCISDEPGNLTRRVCDMYNAIPEKVIKELREAKD